MPEYHRKKQYSGINYTCHTITSSVYKHNKKHFASHLLILLIIVPKAVQISKRADAKTAPVPQ